MDKNEETEIFSPHRGASSKNTGSYFSHNAAE